MCRTEDSKPYFHMLDNPSTRSALYTHSSLACCTVCDDVRNCCVYGSNSVHGSISISNCDISEISSLDIYVKRFFCTEAQSILQFVAYSLHANQVTWASPNTSSLRVVPWFSYSFSCIEHHKHSSSSIIPDKTTSLHERARNIICTSMYISLAVQNSGGRSHNRLAHISDLHDWRSHSVHTTALGQGQITPGCMQAMRCPEDTCQIHGRRLAHARLAASQEA